MRVIGSANIEVHTFIVLEPDNPQDFGGETKRIIGGYQTDDGKLSTEINNQRDVGWPKKS